MALVQLIDSSTATGTVAEIYKQIENTLGRVPNALKTYSTSPELLSRLWHELTYYLSHPRLSQPLLATIRLLVSQHNHCDYCIGFNAGLLINHFGQTPEQVMATQQNPEQTPLADKEKALLLFVLKAVKTPSTINADDIQQIKNLGWEEGDIVDAVTHGARNSAVDIVLNTFKVEQDF